MIGISTDADRRKQTAAILLAHEETRMFVTERHRLADETLRRGCAEFPRDRLLAPLVLVAGFAGGAISACLGMLSGAC